MTASAFHGYVSLQGRGTITLPAELRRRFHLDEPGAQVELTERADGVIEMRAALPIPAAERWFWVDRWQRGEHDVDVHIAEGALSRHADAAALLAHLDEIDRADAT